MLQCCEAAESSLLSIHRQVDATSPGSITLAPSAYIACRRKRDFGLSHAEARLRIEHKAQAPGCGDCDCADAFVGVGRDGDGSNWPLLGAIKRGSADVEKATACLCCWPPLQDIGKIGQERAARRAACQQAASEAE